MKIIFVLFFLMIFTVPIDLSAQTAGSDKSQKTNKTFVSVPVSVSDREGHYISGLKKEDFSLYENGEKRKITFFATYDEPLNIALLLDTSESAQTSLEKIKDAAEDFIELLNPTDKCLLATFDSQLNVLNPFTSDKQALKNSLDKVRTAAKEGTVLYQAVEQIAQKSFNNAQGRKVIVLLSDGKDSSGSVTKYGLLNLLEESDILIYTIFYKTGEDFNKLMIEPDASVKKANENKKAAGKKPKKKKKDYSVFIPAQTGFPSPEEIEFIEKNANIEAIDFLKEMADATAGRFYLGNSPKLSEIFKKIAAELRQQYRLGYQSKDEANNAPDRDIVVKVERADVVVRARGKSRVKLFE